MPGMAYRQPMTPGAPGHGEGHNSGQAVNITAAIAVKKLMEREHMAGYADALAWCRGRRAGLQSIFGTRRCFQECGCGSFHHVGTNLGVNSGPSGGNGLVSVEYTFEGESAHAAAAPQRGRSALDAVELMDVGWNFRREHLRTDQRSHYVITNGGDQPNVVPSNASVWYYFRERDYDHIKELWDIGNKVAEGAALMTNTTVKSRLLGEAWPGYFNKPIADVVSANIQKVGMPQWTDDDQNFAKAFQKMMNQPVQGLSTGARRGGGAGGGRGGQTPGQAQPGGAPAGGGGGGGSDDIGDVSWNVPTVTLSFPSNMPGGPGHNWGECDCHGDSDRAQGRNCREPKFRL